jgi:hypothetical protein
MKVFLVIISIVLIYIFIINNYDDTIEDGQNEHKWPLD